MKVVWFRSDLRIYDNPALTAATNKETTENVRAVFFVTHKQWLSHNWGPNKIGFVLSNLLSLSDNLASLNIDLDIIECQDFKSLPEMLLKYAYSHSCKSLYYNKEYELNEIQRDKSVEDLFKKSNIECHSFDDQCLIAPGEILTKQKTPYTVFTAFKNSCYQYLHENGLSIVGKPKKQSESNLKKEKFSLAEKWMPYLNAKILNSWVPGEKHALNLLDQFCSDSIYTYKKNRDFPLLDGTSSLSPYLAVGALSVKQCFLRAISHNNGEFANGDENIICWISELIWRDFYRNIIFHYPNICKGDNFNKKYDGIKWLSSKTNLSKWQNGQTGIPIIDAAMRQLVSTGWMHNRLRMVTAMFLTKNLLIDWRHGEKFFSEHLVDLDFASNNGGWQWSSSTGTDAVPYFRIFNPITQSERFDPSGDFIKKYCPELIHLNNKDIHNPSSKLSMPEISKIGYPLIMVDLSKSRLRALEAFKII